MGKAILKTCKSNAGEPGSRLILSLNLRNTAKFKPSGNILKSRAPGHEAFGLKHITCAWINPPQGLPKNFNPTRRWLKKASCDIEQG
jgi:hypothetical protein